MSPVSVPCTPPLPVTWLLSPPHPAKATSDDLVARPLGQHWLPSPTPHCPLPSLGCRTAPSSGPLCSLWGFSSFSPPSTSSPLVPAPQSWSGFLPSPPFLGNPLHPFPWLCCHLQSPFQPPTSLLPPRPISPPAWMSSCPRAPLA